MLDHISEGILELDSEWRIVYANRRAELLFGRRHAELVGAEWWELVPYLRGTVTEDELHQTIQGGIPRRLRMFHPPRYAWHEVVAVPQESGLVLVMKDVTDVVRARDSEAVRDAVRQVIDQAPVAISLLRGREHRVEIMNQMARQLLGGQDLEGRSVRVALPELEGQGLFDILDDVYTRGEPFHAREVRLRYDRTGKGEMYEGYFDVSYQPVLENDGRVSGVLSMSVEVTALVAERQRVEQRRRELEAVLSQLGEGVIVTDSDGRITFINEVAERLHGVAELNVGVDRYTEAFGLLTEDGQPHPPETLPLARAVTRGEVVSGARWRIRRPDHGEVLVVGDARPVVDDEGRTIAAVLTLRPVNEGGADAGSAA